MIFEIFFKCVGARKIICSVSKKTLESESINIVNILIYWMVSEDLLWNLSPEELPRKSKQRV